MTVNVRDRPDWDLEQLEIIMDDQGAWQLVIAAVVALVGYRMPSTDTVEHTFTSAGRVTHRAGVQVRLSDWLRTF